MRKQTIGWTGLLALVAGLSVTTIARAQTTPPFIGGPLTVFDIEVSLVDSGALLDAQVAVSPRERKYITINGQGINTHKLALQDFQTQGVLQVGKFGFVGGVTPNGPPPPVVVSTTLPVKTSPTQIAQDDKAALSILNRRGVFLISPAK